MAGGNNGNSGSGNNVLVINSAGAETRVALVENGTIHEYYLERKREKGIVGNIYKGKVVRVPPGMQAAFVDIGLEKAAFLYVGDVYGDPDFSEEFELTEGEHRAEVSEVPDEDEATEAEAEAEARAQAQSASPEPVPPEAAVVPPAEAAPAEATPAPLEAAEAAPLTAIPLTNEIGMAPVPAVPGLPVPPLPDAPGGEDALSPEAEAEAGEVSMAPVPTPLPAI